MTLSAFLGISICIPVVHTRNPTRTCARSCPDSCSLQATSSWTWTANACWSHVMRHELLQVQVHCDFIVTSTWTSTILRLLHDKFIAVDNDMFLGNTIPSTAPSMRVLTRAVYPNSLASSSKPQHFLHHLCPLRCVPHHWWCLPHLISPSRLKRHIAKRLGTRLQIICAYIRELGHRVEIFSRTSGLHSVHNLFDVPETSSGPSTLSRCYRKVVW
jgi:hypothetical protein